MFKIIICVHGKNYHGINTFTSGSVRCHAYFTLSTPLNPTARDLRSTVAGKDPARINSNVLYSTINRIMNSDTAFPNSFYENNLCNKKNLGMKIGNFTYSIHRDCASRSVECMTIMHTALSNALESPPPNQKMRRASP